MFTERKGEFSLQERTQRAQEIFNFLKLNDLPTAEEVQRDLVLSDKPIVWWLKEELIDTSGNIVKGPVDPISKIRADLAQEGYSNSFSLPLIYSGDFLVYKFIDGNFYNRSIEEADTPVFKEMVNDGIKVLEDIGFKPPEPIRGRDWIMPQQQSGLFPTIFPDVDVSIGRYEDGSASSVSLVVYRVDRD